MKQWVKISALLFSSQVLLMAQAVGAEGDSCPGDKTAADDKAVLIKVYESLGGAGWDKGSVTSSTNPWLPSTDHCGWYGVDCNDAGKVTALTLNANLLQGAIPAEIGELGCLETLALHRNRIGGTIPATISSLTLSRLKTFTLDRNKVQGDIPSSLANMTALTAIDFDYNALHVAKDAPAGTDTSLMQKHDDQDFSLTQTLDAQNATVTARTTTSLKLVWDPVTFAKEGGYRIYGATAKTGPFTQYKTINGTGVDTAKGEVIGKSNTSVDVNGLEAGKRYFFIVHSFTNPWISSVPGEGNDNEVESDGLTGNVAEGVTDSNDSDQDGLTNAQENALKTLPNNADSDADGILDRREVDPENPVDTDNDGIIDASDPDDDNDGVLTSKEIQAPALVEEIPGLGVTIPKDAAQKAVFKDTDGDGIPDHKDSDDDGDGVPTATEIGSGKNPRDTDGDGIPDYLDSDDDGDGTPTSVETDNGTNITKDSDGDGIPDYLDPVNNNTAVLGEAATADAVKTSIGGGSAGLGLVVAGLLGLVRRRRLMAAAAVAPLLVASGAVSAAEQSIPDATTPATASADKSLPQASVEKAAGETSSSLTNEQTDFVIQQSQPERGGRIYLGVGGGLSKLDPEIVAGSNATVSDDSDTGYKFLFGYEATDHLAIEAMVGSLGAAKLAPGDLDVDYKLGSLFAVYNMFDHRVGLNPIIKMGIASIDNSTSPSVKDIKVDDATLAGGLGLEYEFKNGFVVRGEYEYYAQDAQMASLSIIKRLGGEPPIVIPAPAPQPVVAPTPPPQVNVAPPSVQVEFKIPDTDGDGVNDIRDACPNTPAGAEVDEVGCAKFQGVLRGVNFEYNSARLTPRARQILDEVAEELKNYPSVRVEVQAHTDSKGSSGYNLWLSERRAQSVIDYLVSQGISRSRLIPIGFGETKPIASNATEQGRALNRRVEFKVIPQR